GAPSTARACPPHPPPSGANTPPHRRQGWRLGGGSWPSGHPTLSRGIGTAPFLAQPRAWVAFAVTARRRSWRTCAPLGLSTTPAELNVRLMLAPVQGNATAVV